MLPVFSRLQSIRVLNRRMTNATIDDICLFLKKKYKLSDETVQQTYATLRKYYNNKKDFDIIVNKGKVMVLAQKTPSPLP